MESGVLQPNSAIVTVLFFAQFRERLQVDRLTFGPELFEQRDHGQQPDNSARADIKVEDLRRLLISRGACWQHCLGEGPQMVAVNQVIANEQSAISLGDEVAFFPPVTGG